MDNTVYLKDGQKAQLIEKITDNKYLIAPVFEYDAYEGEMYEDTGEEKIISELFTKPPEHLFDVKILAAKNILQETEQKHRKLSLENAQISAQIRTLKKTETDLKKLIINKEALMTANRLTVVENYNPVDLKKKEGWRSGQYGFKINFGFSITDEDISISTSRLYENSSDYGMSIDKEVGVLVDKTDDEITEVIKNKASKAKLTDWDLKRIQDIYLNDDLLKRKTELLQTENENEVEKLKNEIALKQTQLELMQQK